MANELPDVDRRDKLRVGVLIYQLYRATSSSCSQPPAMVVNLAVMLVSNSQTSSGTQSSLLAMQGSLTTALGYVHSEPKFFNMHPDIFASLSRLHCFAKDSTNRYGRAASVVTIDRSIRKANKREEPVPLMSGFKYLPRLIVLGDA